MSLENSFHGRTLGALSVTGQPKYRKDFEPLIPGVKFVTANDIAALEAAVSDRTAGIIMEWIQGEGGVLPLDQAFSPPARELADQHDALLCFDEIQCGVGRTGKYFGYQLADPPVMPDIMIAAKPLPAGFRSESLRRMNGRRKRSGPGCMVRRSAAMLWRRVWRSSSSTFSKDCCRRSARGRILSGEMRKLAKPFGFVTEVRGYGLMVGVAAEHSGQGYRRIAPCGKAC